MVYEDIFDAKNACDHLSGFNVCNRYLVVLYYNANRVRMSFTACRWLDQKAKRGKTLDLNAFIFSYMWNMIKEMDKNIFWKTKGL